MKNDWQLITILGVLIFTLTGCEGYNLVIREQLRSKWETKSIEYYAGANTWTLSQLPSEMNGEQINTQGWLIEETTITLYCNGEVIFKGINAYSDNEDKNIFSDPGGGKDDISPTIFVSLNGDTLSLNYLHDTHFYNREHRDTCKRVSKFSWE